MTTDSKRDLPAMPEEMAIAFGEIVPRLKRVNLSELGGVVPCYGQKNMTPKSEK